MYKVTISVCVGEYHEEQMQLLLEHTNAYVQKILSYHSLMTFLFFARLQHFSFVYATHNVFSEVLKGYWISIMYFFLSTVL